MSNEVAVQSTDLQALLGIKKNEVSADVASVLGAGGSFLPSVRFMGPMVAEVKQGKFKGLNHFALIENETITDLGEMVDVLVLSVRPLGINKNGVTASGEIGTVFCYDPKLDDKGQPTGMYKEIVEKSDIKDSGCFYGPEFLLYIPKVQKFACFLMGSKTSRNDARTLVARMGQAVTLRGHLIPNKKHGDYMSPEGVACTTVFQLPPVTDILTQVDNFKNPKSSAVGAAASAEEVAGTDRER
jgi:hypothetical protein